MKKHSLVIIGLVLLSLCYFIYLGQGKSRRSQANGF